MHIRLLVAAIALAPAAGFAQTPLPTARYVRAGAHRTIAASLAPGASVLSTQTHDVDRDGQADALLVVRPALRPGDEFQDAREGCVLARRAAGGWTATLLEANPGSPNVHVRWSAPLDTGRVTVIVTEVREDGARDFGDETVTVQRLYVAHRGAAVRLLAAVDADQTGAPWQLAADGPAHVRIGVPTRGLQIRLPLP